MTQAGQPYSQRDPYWGVDDYGRPLSYGRPSIYGPPKVADAAQLAEQLTYRQSRPDQLPIDPVALQAPSVFRPLWPVSVQPAVNQPLPADDQATEWVGVEQKTMRFAPVPNAASGFSLEQETVRTVPRLVSTPATAVSGPDDDQLTLAVMPRPEALRAPITRQVESAPQSYPPPYSELIEPGVSAVPARRGRFIMVAALILALLTAGTWYYLADSPDSTPDANSGPTGAFERAWQAPEPGLTLDMVAVNDTVVSVECQPASQRAAGTYSAQGDAAVVRTRERPESCSLIGRELRGGEPRWTLDRQPIGVALASIGPAVIAYGGAQTLVVSATTGEITRTLAHGVLLGHTGTTAVFAENITDATSRVIALDVTDGRQLWQRPVAQSPAAENARALSQASVSVPSGFDRMYYDGHESDDRYVMMPDATKAGEYRIHEIASGEPAQPNPDGRIFGVAAGYALHVTGDGDERVLRGTALGAADATPSWSYELPPGGYVAACSGLVCVQDVNQHRSVVLDPAGGETIYRNDSGWSYAHRSGDLVAIVRCPAAREASVCPGGDADVEVISVSDRTSVWSGTKPAFVASQGGPGDGRFLVGVASADSVRVLTFSGDRRSPVTVGVVPLQALESVLLPIDESAVADRPGSGKETAVPNLSCMATEATLSCGSRWTPTRAVTWNVTQRG